MRFLLLPLSLVLLSSVCLAQRNPTMNFHEASDSDYCYRKLPSI
jgi:hypothetical protein